MTALSNPFDILPPNLFNLFSTQGQGEWQRHYMAILLRIYEVAEFNRFGLTRELVVAEIVDYLDNEDVDALTGSIDISEGDATGTAGNITPGGGWFLLPSSGGAFIINSSGDPATDPYLEQTLTGLVPGMSTC